MGALAWVQASTAVGKVWPSCGVATFLYVAIGFAAITNKEGAIFSIFAAVCQLVLISAGGGIAILANIPMSWQGFVEIIAYAGLAFIMFTSFFGNMVLLTLAVGLPMMVGFALALYTLGLVALYDCPIVRSINAMVLYLCLGIMVGGYLLLKIGCLPENARLPVPEAVFLVALLWILAATSEFSVDAGWAKPNLVPATQAFFGLSAGLSAFSSFPLRILFGILGAAL